MEPTSNSLEQAALAGVFSAVKSISEDLIRATGSLAKNEFDKLLVDFEIGFKKYIRRNYEKCSKVKTLLHRYQPVDLESAYVPAQIKFGDKPISETTLLNELNTLKRVVITGIAGSGKSMFAKHIFLSLCKNATKKIPVYIELRHLNNESRKSLNDYIFEQLSSLITYLKPAQFEYALRQGKLLLILDGLDEIDHLSRDDYCKQLLQLSDKFNDLVLIVSSRPDERFISWNEFHTGRIMPFEKQQVIELIEKIEYDEVVKKNFLKQVDSSLYKSHQQFLSNPLLCTMMLMTFDQFAEIPSKMHIFYSQAFDVLFNKHDATKASFRRKFYTTLSIDDFKRIFGTFCALTYLDRKLSLTDSAAQKYISLSIEYEGVKLIPADFLRDLQESICIVLKDGDLYTFLHRSFQEYFVATFLAERPGEGIGEVIERVVELRTGDSVPDLLIEINRDSFEAKYFAKRVAELSRVVAKINVLKNPQKLLRLFFLKLSFDIRGEDERYHQMYVIAEGTKRAKWFATWEILRDHYPVIWHPAPSENFDWNAHLRKNKIEIGGSFEIEANKISNDLLKSSPVIEYLEYIKALVLHADKEIRARVTDRRQLLSDVLTRRKPN